MSRKDSAKDKPGPVNGTGRRVRRRKFKQLLTEKIVMGPVVVDVQHVDGHYLVRVDGPTDGDCGCGHGNDKTA